MLALFVSIGGVSVAAVKLKKNSVTTKTIRTAAVTNPKLAPNAVDAGKIADASILTSKLADKAATTAKIADNAINSAQIADDAVGSSEIASNAVGAPEIAPDSIGSSELGPDAVTGEAFFRAVEVSVDPPNLSANTGSNCTGAATAAVNGVDPGDHVFASPEALDAGLVMFPLVVTADEVQLRVCNLSEAAIDQGPIDVFILVIR